MNSNNIHNTNTMKKHLLLTLFSLALASLAAVDGGKLAAVQGVGLSQALQGSMPGVQVVHPLA